MLLLLIVGVGVTVALGLRGRSESPPSAVEGRTDPEAVIETRGSRIVQADDRGENLRVVADRQATYRDGALRLVDNVKVTVAARDERASFVLTGHEARLDSAKTDVELSGDVRMESADGLLATTDEATYSDVDGIVRMPGFTTLRRDGLEATGGRAQYDRATDVLRLLESAQVDLVFDMTHFRILSRRATLAHADGYMQFDGDVTVDDGVERMTAGQARAVLVGQTTQLTSLKLRRRASVVTDRMDPGALREMSADTIHLAYASSGAGLETATLTGGAMLTTVGDGGAAGARIGGRSMQLEFDTDGDILRDLRVEHTVSLALPERPESPAQRITAARLTATGVAGAQLETARFEGNVVFEEESTGDRRDSPGRVLRARMLDATLGSGLAELEDARFIGDVRLEDDAIIALADEVFYAVSEGRIRLLTVEGQGRVPRLDDGRGSVQAGAITVDVEGADVVAEGDVKSVLTTESETEATELGRVRPSLLGAEETVYVTAGRFEYDDDLRTATYAAGARLWQAETEFEGEQIVLDEARGDITAQGGVRTRTRITQVNDETGLPEGTTTIGRAEMFRFEDAAHRLTYTTDARVTSPQSDLTADLIHLILLPDGRTLDRIEAVGSVQLQMTGRRVSGQSLVYHDAEGRYTMDGRPVEIIEEIDGECRETTGRTLTFFLIDDAVSVDGGSEVRTQTSRGECPDLTR